MPNKPEPPMNSKLRKALYAYMDRHGNTLSQWKNNDYDYAQTLPKSEQEEIVPELIEAIRKAVAEEVLDIVNSPSATLVGSDGAWIKQSELRQKIKQWSQS